MRCDSVDEDCERIIWNLIGNGEKKRKGKRENFVIKGKGVTLKGEI